MDWPNYDYMEQYDIIDLLNDLQDAANDIAFDSKQTHVWKFKSRVVRIREKMDEITAILAELDEREEVEE